MYSPVLKKWRLFKSQDCFYDNSLYRVFWWDPRVDADFLVWPQWGLCKTCRSILFCTGLCCHMFMSIIITYELDLFSLLQVRSFDVRDLCRCCHFSTSPLKIPWKDGACTYRCFIIELFLYEHVYFDCEINTNDCHYAGMQYSIVCDLSWHPSLELTTVEHEQTNICCTAYFFLFDTSVLWIERQCFHLYLHVQFLFNMPRDLICSQQFVWFSNNHATLKNE